MSQPLVTLNPPRPSAWHMYRSMVGIGLICGFLIVLAYQLTKPVITRKKAAALQAAIFTVLPAATASATFELGPDGSFHRYEGELGTNTGELAYGGYDAAGELVGIAIEAAGMGYQDTIRLLWGYDFARHAIVGLQVLESKETPGLGDKIQADEGFKKNFEQLDVSLSDDASTMRNPITFVKNGEKTDPWQIEGITGATISSTAVANILRTSTALWTPRLDQHLDDFRIDPSDDSGKAGPQS